MHSYLDKRNTELEKISNSASYFVGYAGRCLESYDKGEFDYLGKEGSKDYLIQSFREQLELLKKSLSNELHGEYEEFKEDNRTIHYCYVCNSIASNQCCDKWVCSSECYSIVMGEEI